MSYSQQNQPHRRRRIAASIENNQQQNFDSIVAGDFNSINNDPFFAARKRRDPKKSDLDDHFSSSVIENVSLLGADHQQNDENIASASTSTFDLTMTSSTMGDRTLEFRTIGKNFQLKAQSNNTSNRKQQRIGQILAESAKFNQYARKIGADLASTFSKLEKLTLLIKQSGAFSDCGPEIDELRHIIKLDIEGMYRDVNHLQQMMTERQQFRNGVKNQTATHSKSIVLGLQSKLASMSSEFRNVLEVRTENLRQQKTRRERLGGGPSSNVPSSMPPSASTGRLGSILLQDEYRSRGENTILDIGQQQQSSDQKQLTRTGGQTDYLRSRVEAMENVESTIVDMGQIFSQLAHMIQEQGEMVQRIDTHVDEANLHVEAAHMQLLQYMRSISNNRWLALKVFGVLIVFFIIFIIFLV